MNEAWKECYCYECGALKEIRHITRDGRAVGAMVPAWYVRADLACGHHGRYVITDENLDRLHAGPVYKREPVTA